MKQYSRGFTIVELLIVIIVIGILASISVVAYRGSQERAEYARAQTDLKHINDALIIYKAQNPTYPDADTYIDTSDGILTSALVPGYLDKMPVPKNGFAYKYISSADDKDYKLLRYKLGGLPSVETSVGTTSQPALNTLSTGTYTSLNSWGYWSSNGANL
jgi:general secretion pathway protein G